MIFSEDWSVSRDLSF